MAPDGSIGHPAVARRLYDALSNLPFRQIFPLYRANDPLILRFLETLPADGAEKAKRWWESRVRWF